MNQYNFLNEIKDSGDRVLDILNNDEELVYNDNGNSSQIVTVCLICEKYEIIEKRYIKNKSRFFYHNLNYVENKFMNCKTLYCKCCRTISVIPIIEGSIIFDYDYLNIKYIISKMLQKFDELKYDLSNEKFYLCFSIDV